MAVKELGHVVLYVSDLGRSAAFYGDVLGFIRVSPDMSDFPAAAFITESHRTHHELLLIEVGANAQPVPRGRRVGLYHIGLKVGDTDQELRDMLSRLEDHDVTIVGSSDHHVTHSLYVLDPDGNEIELYIDVADVDWRDDPAAVLAPVRPLHL